LLELWTNDGMYKQISEYARGNALSWLFLADSWANREGVVPKERWVNDLARVEAGFPYREMENRLPRF